MRKKRILVAPLDWGLGHATRCIPIINELLKKNVDVIIGADNRPAALLKKEFPQLEHIRYPGYDMYYSINGNMAWTMSLQLPKLYKGIAKEHAMLESMIDTYNIDAIISDNRWGAYSSRIPSIYVVTQLRILLPPLIRWGQWIIDSVNKKMISRFNEVWIPDFNSPNNILGNLVPASLVTDKTFFIGPLSRLNKIEGVKKKLDLLVILSGLEPQRTVVEELIVKQLKETTLRALIIRGTPESNTKFTLTDTLTMVSALTAEQLSEAIASSEMILSRSGHSTIMDLYFLGANAIFIPTPQQTEHEYLAKRMKERKIFYSEPQEEFSLERSLQKSRSYSGFPKTQHDLSVLQQRIDHLIDRIPE